MPRGKAIKLGASAAALIIAVSVLAIAYRPERPTLAPDARPLDCICEKCGRHFQIAYELYLKSRTRRVAAGAADPTEPRMRAGGAAGECVKCTQCGEFAAVLANRCPQHDCYYPKTAADGSRGRCPKCSAKVEKEELRM